MITLEDVIKNEEVQKQLLNHGILKQIGKEKVFYAELEAIEYAKEQLRLS